MRYEFHPEAEQELYESASHYEAVVPGLGRRFGGEVERVIQFGSSTSSATKFQVRG